MEFAIIAREMNGVIIFIVPICCDIIPRLDKEQFAESNLPLAFQRHVIMELGLVPCQGVFGEKILTTITGKRYVEVAHVSFFLLPLVRGEDNLVNCTVTISKRSRVRF